MTIRPTADARTVVATVLSLSRALLVGAGFLLGIAGCDDISYDLDPLRPPILDSTTKAELLQDTGACRTLNAKVGQFDAAIQDGTIKERAERVRDIATNGLAWLPKCPLSSYAASQLTVYFRMNRAWSAAMLGKDVYGDIADLSNLYLFCSRASRLAEETNGMQPENVIDKTVCDWNLGTLNHLKEDLRKNESEPAVASGPLRVASIATAPPHNAKPAVSLNALAQAEPSACRASFDEARKLDALLRSIQGGESARPARTLSDSEMEGAKKCKNETVRNLALMYAFGMSGRLNQSTQGPKETSKSLLEGSLAAGYLVLKARSLEPQDRSHVLRDVEAYQRDLAALQIEGTRSP